MAVVKLKSTIFEGTGVNGYQAPDSSALQGVFHRVAGRVTNSATDNTGSTYLIAQIPWAAILLHDSTIRTDAWGFAQAVVGTPEDPDGLYDAAIEVLPSDDGTSQDLWLVVRRLLGGVTRFCIERMEPPFIDLDGTGADLGKAWHQMCARRWQGDPSAIVSGLSHLAGETVTAWTDLGAFVGHLVSPAGEVHLPQQVTWAVVGIDVTDRQRFDTLDVVIGQPDGGDDGRLRTHRVTGVRVHRSAGGTFQVCRGSDGKEIEDTPSRP